MNWENVIKWTPSCPECKTPMDKKKVGKRWGWSGSKHNQRDSAIFECPNCGHKERF